MAVLMAAILSGEVLTQSTEQESHQTRIILLLDELTERAYTTRVQPGYPSLVPEIAPLLNLQGHSGIHQGLSKIPDYMLPVFPRPMEDHDSLFTQSIWVRKRIIHSLAPNIVGILVR
jgi:hypothetical protein